MLPFSMLALTFKISNKFYCDPDAKTMKLKNIVEGLIIIHNNQFPPIL